MRFIRSFSLFAAILAAAVVAPDAHAQDTTSQPSIRQGAADKYFAGATLSATPTANCVDTSDTASTSGYSTATAIVTGTATSLTVSFAATSVQNPTLAAQWVPLPMLPQSGGPGLATLTTTATGTFVAPIAGFRQVCAYISTYSSGSVAINWNISDKPRPDLTRDAMRVPFTCSLFATTATTSTQVTGCAVSTGLSYYVASVSISGDILSATATPAILQSGTSTACTGPHLLVEGYHPALSTFSPSIAIPIKATQSEGLCILDGTTGTKDIIVTGYLAP